MGAGSKNFRDPTENIEGVLLDKVTANSNGEWIGVKGWDKLGIHISFSANANASVGIYGSMEDGAIEGDPPLNSYDGVDLISSKIVTNLTTNPVAANGDVIASIKTPLKWVKCKPTVISGEVNAKIVGV
jgi:hypothetical protein